MTKGTHATDAWLKERWMSNEAGDLLSEAQRRLEFPDTISQRAIVDCVADPHSSLDQFCDGDRQANIGPQGIYR